MSERTDPPPKPAPAPEPQLMRVAQTLDRPSRGAKFESGNPILRVRCLAASIDYYVRRLGFDLDWEAPGTIASVSRDGLALLLCDGDQGRPGSWVWIGVDDADSLFEEYQSAGAVIRHPPTNYAWAYEMQVEDLDGNVLRIGSEPRPDQPFGAWLDMHGRTWTKLSDEGSS